MSYAEMRLPSASLPVVAWKPRSPTQCCAHACGQPSRCRRSSAIVVAERRLEMVDELAQPVLRLADREVAVRLAGARDRVRPDLVRRQRQAERVELRERRLDVGDAGDDQVLLARQADVAAERLDEVGDRDQLVARREPELDGHADVGEPVLLLRRARRCARRVARRSAATRTARACGRASPRRARACPRRRCRRP